MIINFTKMHGLGNDFMVVDMISQHVHLRPEHIQRMADRNTGIGFDQLLLVETPSDPTVDFKYRIFNSDGGEVEQCGNGARCFAVFVREKKLTNKTLIKVETLSGIIELKVGEEGRVEVDMGAPHLTLAKIPMLGEASGEGQQSLQYDNETYTVFPVSMGNPHAVLTVEDVSKAPVDSLGAGLESHPSFPERVNVGFMEVVHKKFIRLRVFERGVGETQACGTGACAAVVAGIKQGLLDDEVEVKLPGGNLHIRWHGANTPVLMEGPATMVFEGKIRI